MFKFNPFRLILIFSLFAMFTVMMSCGAPKSGKYRNHQPVGSSSQYRSSSSKQMKARQNVIPISKNYKIRNKKSNSN